MTEAVILCGASGVDLVGLSCSNTPHVLIRSSNPCRPRVAARICHPPTGSCALTSLFHPASSCLLLTFHPPILCNLRATPGSVLCCYILRRCLKVPSRTAACRSFPLWADHRYVVVGEAAFDPIVLDWQQSTVSESPKRHDVNLSDKDRRYVGGWLESNTAVARRLRSMPSAVSWWSSGRGVKSLGQHHGPVFAWLCNVHVKDSVKASRLSETHITRVKSLPSVATWWTLKLPSQHSERISQDENDEVTSSARDFGFEHRWRPFVTPAEMLQAACRRKRSAPVQLYWSFLPKVGWP
eukprot:2947766-Rhodomonas_salina.2